MVNLLTTLPKAALNPCTDENDTVAPLRLRRLAQGGADAGSAFPPGASNAMSVYVTMHRIRRLVMAAIDDAFTLDELRAPHIDHLVVRPLVDRLYNPENPALVYCLVANRVQFLRPRSNEALHQSINESRAILCELLATRVLRRFHEDHPGRSGLLLLANILVSGFDPCDTAPESVRSRRPQWAIQKRGGHERKLTALELAIISESKLLIKSPACQLVVDSVYKGVVVYTPLSFVDFLPDHYKYHPVSLYEPRRAAILNHHRLIVPQLRNVIELMHFAILLVLYMLTVAHYGFGADKSGLRAYETVFNVFAAGWVLEQFAAVVEHGWEVHAQNLWSFLDVTFVFIYAAYGLVRSVELLFMSDAYYALPVLCTAAPVLLTRIAFTLMPDNIVFIALHAMMRDFTRLTFIAIWCFAGFVMGLLFLARTSGDLNASVTWATITKWLLWIWFGLDGTGIERAADFHLILGPTLIITFAFLGNTLFLTILVAILTNTFSKIISNEAAEIQFRRAVLTFQGVKSDAIFSYPPPFNILAMLILLPLKFVVGPVAFHHINVAVIRTINAPVLLLIGLWERRRVWARRSKPGRPGRWRYFTGLSPHVDIQVVFGSEPPPEVLDELEKLDLLHEVRAERDLAGPPSTWRDIAPSSVRRRKASNSSSHRIFDG
ncbi:Calcium channel YVC1 [Madurella mycetomatis]|uniref:Calcium channel YVC1 n=1 Tax=Madurella mycetomatis TaxID=100816 RepID=A0A175WE73_9PEZI|nr:Calcium channel YVC1 [Madurella mycetomatis]